MVHIHKQFGSTRQSALLDQPLPLLVCSQEDLQYFLMREHGVYYSPKTEKDDNGEMAKHSHLEVHRNWWMKNKLIGCWMNNDTDALVF
jgi:hypothetical protein